MIIYQKMVKLHSFYLDEELWHQFRKQSLQQKKSASERIAEFVENEIEKDNIE